VIHFGTDGTIFATGNDTRYDIDVVKADGSRFAIGRVDLGETTWHWDGDYGSVIGQFGPSRTGHDRSTGLSSVGTSP
jgi:hypothetical protein